MTGPWLAVIILWAAIIAGFILCGWPDKGAKHGG